MMLKSLVVSAIAGAVMAFPEPVAAPIAHVEVLQVRQMSSAAVSLSEIPAGTGCLPPSNILSLLTSIPTPASELVSALVTVTDPCKLPKFTGTLSAPFQSYSSQISSWYSQNSAPLLSFQSDFSKNCPAASGLNLNVCSTAAGGAATTSGASSRSSGAATGAASGTTARTSSGTGTATSAQSTAAAGQNIVSYGAAAVAGFVGAVAML